MKITVIGPGRWGSCITWYLNKIGHDVTLYGRASSEAIKGYLHGGKGEYVDLPESVKISTDLSVAKGAEVIVISIPSQSLFGLMEELKPLDLSGKIFVLCMKGIDVSTGKRLSEIVEENTSASNKVAVWLGPGHVQEFYRGVPNCMVIDSRDDNVKEKLVSEFSGDLIRFYYGNDVIGNEIGAAAKNVIGIAAGLLDGLDLGTLKGALMSRGTREIARLISAMGGNELSAYGLCHLGDYEATVCSEFSHTRRLGVAFSRGETFDKLAEGYYTVKALKKFGEDLHVDLPICNAVYNVLYCGVSVKDALLVLFSRSQKNEF